MALHYAGLGTVGAIVLVVGLVLVGSGFALTALAEQSEINCNFGAANNCEQTSRNAANTTVAAEYIIAAGAMVSGVGIFLVVFAMISIMARREQTASLAPPPAGGPGPVQFPSMDGPPPPQSPPPGTPPVHW